MNIRQFEYVYNIVKYKTIREAARRLFVSQPTISQQVSNLEQQLGFPLFERDGRKIKLTPQGKKIYPDIIDVVESMEKLKRNIPNIRDPKNGEVSFGLGPVSSDSLIQTLHENFSEKYPDVTINIIESGSMELLALVEKNNVDVAIINTSDDTRSYMENKNIICKPLFHSEFVLMVPESHDLSSKKSVSYKDITNESIMLYRNGLIQKSIIQLLGPEFKKNIILSFVDYISIINLVRDGVGISIVPKSYAKSWSKEQVKGLNFLNFNDFGKSMNVSRIYKQREYYPEYLLDFNNLLTSTMKNLGKHFTDNNCYLTSQK